MKTKETQQFSQITGNSIVVASLNHTRCDLIGESETLTLDSGIYLFGVNSVGSRIWSLMCEPTRVREIVDGLRQVYEIDTHDCEKHVVDFLGDLEQVGLIEVEDDAYEPDVSPTQEDEQAFS